MLVTSCRRSTPSFSCDADRRRAERLNFIDAKAALDSYDPPMMRWTKNDLWLEYSPRSTGSPM